MLVWRHLRNVKPGEHALEVCFSILLQGIVGVAGSPGPQGIPGMRVSDVVFKFLFTYCVKMFDSNDNDNNNESENDNGNDKHNDNDNDNNNGNGKTM